MSNTFDKFSESDIAKIGELVEALDKSSFDFLSLELAEFKLTVGKGNVSAEALAGAQPGATITAAGSPVAAVSQAPAPAAAAIAPAEAAAASPAAPVEEGLVDVVATTMGRFYTRPEPNAPPYVAVGDRVEAGTTVGLIELMKLFNGVTAGVDGTVAQICVEEAQLVEFGQVLMRIRPTD